MPKEDVLSLVLVHVAKWVFVKKDSDSLLVVGIFYTIVKPLFVAEG